MLEKKQKIIDYIYTITNQTNLEYPGIFKEKEIKRIIDMFQDSPEQYEDVVKKISELIQKLIQEYLLKKALMDKMRNVKLNYNVHTYRSGKEEYTSCTDIVKIAKEKGITNLGFCDKIPNPPLVLPDEDNRMLLGEVDEYLALINKLKNDNPEMVILSGFESEYDLTKESFLVEMRQKVDYMVLGQDFVSSEMKQIIALGNPNYPVEYANMLVKAMESGLFDIVNHPDFFMKFRDTMTSEQAKELFDKNCVIASKIICQKAKEMGLPLQMTLDPKILSDGNLSYPHPLFWKTASLIEGLKVLKGFDEKSFENIKQLKSIIAMVNNKIISDNYNPLFARQNNKLLQEKYKISQDRALTIDAQIVNQILGEINFKIPENIDSYTTMLFMQKGLDETIQKCISMANQKDKNTVNQLSAIAQSSSINTDKKIIVARKKMALGETNRVLAYQQKIVGDAKNAVKSSVNMGCDNKNEIKNVSTQIIEYNASKNPDKKNLASRNISNFKESKNIKTNTSKGPVLKLTKPSGSSNTRPSNKGAVNIIMISLIVVFVIGIIIGICYMLIV